MCDGYTPFALAFVTNEIDTTGYEIARSAAEKAPAVANTAQKGKTRGRTPLRGFRALLRRLRPF